VGAGGRYLALHVDRTKARPRYAYLLFGAGPRVSIGASFAMIEATVIGWISRRLHTIPTYLAPPCPDGAFSFKELAICHSRVIRHSERFAANLRFPSTSAPAAQSGLLLPAPQKERPAEAGQQVRIASKRSADRPQINRGQNKSDE